VKNRNGKVMEHWQPPVIKITNGQLRTFQKYRKINRTYRLNRLNRKRTIYPVLYLIDLGLSARDFYAAKVLICHVFFTYTVHTYAYIWFTNTASLIDISTSDRNFTSVLLASFSTGLLTWRCCRSANHNFIHVSIVISRSIFIDPLTLVLRSRFT